MEPAGEEPLSPHEALVRAQELVLVGDAADLSTIARLADQAHQGGIAGAGLVFAEAMDKATLYRGQPQPYGTVMVEHQGEIVQPPVDPTVSDTERESLGVPTLGELRNIAEHMTRDLAIERADKPGWLPPGQKFCRVWTDPSPAQLRERMRVEGASAWLDGDVITFVAESAAPVAVMPTFPILSWDVGDGLHVLQMRVDGASEAVITYTFTPAGGGGSMRFSRGSHDGRFRGPDAPPELPSNDPLVGMLADHDVESAAFGGPRRVTVYCPDGHQPGEAIPVVYATDGNMFAPYARRLDAAIEAGSCPRVIVIAAHAAPMDQVRGNIRALEYLRGFDDARFAAHQEFFVRELPAWAASEFGVATDRGLRGIFGCSDGGGHTTSTALAHPQEFAHAFAFSTGTPPELTTPWGDDAPFLHLCAGTLEPGFHQATTGWAGYLHAVGGDFHLTERVAGHDLIQWCEELPIALNRAWGSH